MPTDEPVGNAVIVAGETIIPGIAHFLKGDVREGLRYGILGIAARAMYGLPGLALVAASSYTKATTGRRLIDHLGVQRALHAADEAPPAATTR